MGDFELLYVAICFHLKSIFFITTWKIDCLWIEARIRSRRPGPQSNQEIMVV